MVESLKQLYCRIELVIDSLFLCIQLQCIWTLKSIIALEKMSQSRNVKEAFDQTRCRNGIVNREIFRGKHRVKQSC